MTLAGWRETYEETCEFIAVDAPNRASGPVSEEVTRFFGESTERFEWTSYNQSGFGVGAVKFCSPLKWSSRSRSAARVFYTPSHTSGRILNFASLL